VQNVNVLLSLNFDIIDYVTAHNLFSLSEVVHAPENKVRKFCSFVWINSCIWL